METYSENRGITLKRRMWWVWVLVLVSAVIGTCGDVLARTVVVFAPHPDDEALLASGVIYSAKRNGDTVKVVLATNGDCPSSTLAHTRELETMAAMRDVLGLANDDVIFLGYPDCGLEVLYTTFTSPVSVFTSAAGHTQTYAYEGLGGTDYHRYIHGVPANYNKPSMIQDIKTVLSTYDPNEVYVTSGYDDHSDHSALYFFVVESMVELVKEQPSFRARLYEGFVHDPCEFCNPSYRWPFPAFTPDQYFPEPPYLFTTPLRWLDVQSLEVPVEMQDPAQGTNVKYQGISRYLTQVTGWFYAFVKKDEVFWKKDLFTNLALRAAASASSERTIDSALAGKVNDGFVMGRPQKRDGEWSSDGESAGAWVQLTWPQSEMISRVILYDRPNGTDNVLGGMLTFSDGSSLAVGALSNNGTGLAIDFPSKPVTWVRFTASNVAGEAGLAELEVYLDPDPTNTTPQITNGPTATPGVITDAQTSTVSVMSLDPDGDPVSYSWTATGGTIVGSGATVTYRPPLVNMTTVYQLTVTVTDGRGGSLSGSVDITVSAAPRPVNIAPAAAVTASSQNTATGQHATKAIDGVVSGYPADATREWVTTGQLAGAWITLAWSTPQAVSRIVLHDRINSTERVLGGTLQFSDGSSVAVGALPNDGAAYNVDFASKTVTWVTFQITSAQGSNIGLAEIEVVRWMSGNNTAPQITAGPTANPVTITEIDTSSVSVTATDADGDPLIYSWTATDGTISGSGVTVTYTPPAVSTTTTYQVNVVVSDGRGGAMTGAVSVTVTPGPVNIALGAAATASSQNTTTGQQAAKAIDGVVSGYPADPTREWVTTGQLAGAWITLTWSTPQMVSRVVLHDRINTTDRILGGNLQFSDGSSMAVGTLPNDGSAYSANFAAKTVTWITFQITSAQGANTGLAEIEVLQFMDLTDTAPQIVTGPTASPGAITDGETSSVGVTATDVDGDQLSYWWTATGGTVSGSGATATYTPPLVSATTVYQVNVVVSDGRGGTVTGSVLVTVDPRPNMAPQIVTGPTASPGAITDAQTSTLSMTATDGDSDPLTYSWSATGGTVSGSGAMVTYTPPVVSATTVYQVNVTVTDGRGGSATGLVQITVSQSPVPVNVALSAVATASSQNTTTGQQAAKAIDGVVSGYPVDPTREWVTMGQTAGAWITLTWSTPQTMSRVVLHDRINTTDRILGGNLQFSDGSSIAVGTLPNNGAAYTVDFAAKTVTWVRFQVSSAQGGNTGLAEFEVIHFIDAANTSPQLTAGPTASPGAITDAQTSSVSVTATDVDGDLLTYWWTASGGTVSGSGPTVTYTPPGVSATTVYQVNVVVTDGRGGSATGSILLTVDPRPNTAPQITAGPTASPGAITVGQTSSVSVTATDADGDLLTYSWTAAGGSVSGSGATVTYTPPVVSTTTVYQINVTVTDGRGGSVTGSLQITVSPPPNVALNAVATASSQNTTTGQLAAKAIDGVVSGSPTDPTREWATTGQLAGAWITLTWSTPQTITRVVLHDRINRTDQILGGTLQFSDGSSIAVGTLPNNGAAYTVNFAAKTVTSVTLQITNARGVNIGLAEISVF